MQKADDGFTISFTFTFESYACIEGIFGIGNPEIKSTVEAFLINKVCETMPYCIVFGKIPKTALGLYFREAYDEINRETHSGLLRRFSYADVEKRFIEKVNTLSLFCQAAGLLPQKSTNTKLVSLAGVCRMLGAYNVDYLGSSFDGDTEYEMVIITKFNEKDKEVGRRTLYFLKKKEGMSYDIPNILTIAEAESFYGRKNNERIVPETV